MKKLDGTTLVEALMTLCVLGIVIPASMGAFGSVMTAGLKLHEKASMLSASEWWLAQITLPACVDDINGSPRTDRNGIRFEWKAENLPDETVRVELRVYGKLSGSALTVNRIF